MLNTKHGEAACTGIRNCKCLYQKQNTETKKLNANLITFIEMMESIQKWGKRIVKNRNEYKYEITKADIEPLITLKSSFSNKTVCLKGVNSIFWE